MSEAYLSITPVISQIRIYDQPDGYDQRLPYSGIITVTYLNDKTVYLSGAMGKIDRSVYLQIAKLLKSQGIEECLFERRGSFITRSVDSAV